MSVITVSSRNVVEYLKKLKKEDPKHNDQHVIGEGSRIVLSILSEILSQLKKEKERCQAKESST
jgi:hypothetical protein